MDELKTILALEAAIGEVLSLDEEAPGVWFLVGRKTEESFTTEYYLVAQESKIISDQAKSYGTPLEGYPALLLYSMDVWDSGFQIVRYEIAIYQQKRAGTPETLGELRDAAIFGSETHPEYFGECPAPVDTPKGRMLRSKRIWTGLWCLETDQGERLVAFSIPLWKNELTPLALSYAERPPRHEDNWGYLFFSWEESCIPLFEWLDHHPECKEIEILDYAALEKVIRNRCTHYLLELNKMMTWGERFFGEYGFEMPVLPDKLRTPVPRVSFDFLKF